MSITQCGGTRYRTTGRIRVRAGRKQELETDRSKGENAGRLDEENKLATNKQRTQVIMRGDGRHLVGGGDNHKDRCNRSGCDNYHSTCLS